MKSSNRWIRYGRAKLERMRLVVLKERVTIAERGATLIIKIIFSPEVLRPSLHHKRP